MIQRIVAAHPGVRTIIFQDDIFAFTQDRRVLPLCEGIVAAKERGELPRGAAVHQHEPHRCHDRRAARRPCAAPAFACSASASRASRRALSRSSTKAQIHRHIEPVLSAALELGITPFLDLILSSPRSSLEDLAETLREAYRWLLRGCEIGIYPYVIPFSGAAFARDSSLAPHTIHERRRVAGTDVEWEQPAKILPIDPQVREAVLRIESDFERRLAAIEDGVHTCPRGCARWCGS